MVLANHVSSGNLGAFRVVFERAFDIRSTQGLSIHKLVIRDLENYNILMARYLSIIKGVSDGTVNLSRLIIILIKNKSITY